MCIQQKALPILQQAVRVLQVGLALADRLHLGPAQRHASLELIGQKIIKARRPVERGIAHARPPPGRGPSASPQASAVGQSSDWRANGACNLLLSTCLQCGNGSIVTHAIRPRTSNPEPLAPATTFTESVNAIKNPDAKPVSSGIAESPIVGDAPQRTSQTTQPTHPQFSRLNVYRMLYSRERSRLSAFTTAGSILPFHTRIRTAGKVGALAGAAHSNV